MALLLAAVLTAGVFVGDWLYLGSTTGPPRLVAPLVWLALPPLLALVALVALVAATPTVLERRRRWAEVPLDVGRAARRRVGRLSAQAGLKDAPRLMWNAAAAGATAQAYGVPGRYRIAIAPALLGAASRRPDVFDTVLRHELAHVRNHDVVPAAVARVAGYVVIVLLAVPVAGRIADHDLSLLPDFLWRAVLLALLVRAIRAAVLRCREHYADVRAASWSDQPLHIAEILSSSRVVLRNRPWRKPGWFALHPTPDRRAAIVRAPELLGRPQAVELLTAALLAAAAQPLLQELLVASGESSATADRTSHTVAYAAVGTVVASVALRAVGTRTLDYRALLGSAVVLVVGAGSGAAMSLAGTGVLSPLPGVPAELAGTALSYLLVEVLTCAVAGSALLVLLTDGLRLRHDSGDREPGTSSTLLLGTLGGGLAAAATFPVALLFTRAGPAVTQGVLLDKVGNDLAAGALGLLAVAGAVVVLLAARRRSSLRRGLWTGVAAGVIATAGSIALRLHMLPFPDDDAAWRYYAGMAWIAITAAAVAAVLVSALGREGAPLGIVASAVACVTATVGFALTQSIAVRLVDPQTAVMTFQYMGNMAAVTSPPLAAAASMLTGATLRGTAQTSP
ncbi:M48 family metalloprotease [Streptomyces sp. NPDC060232]|uniref:M48 family metalloprotease n=1 Tax=Streptomyces sp. NPDC060232 TaxID=3347079 RepID=UPI00366603E4